MIIGAALCAGGCIGPRSDPAPTSGITTIGVGGIEGTGFRGYFVQHGYRTELHGTVPFRLSREGLSEFEIRKFDPESTLSVVAQTDRRLDHWEIAKQAGSGVSGLRLWVWDGLTAEPVVP